MTQIYQMIFKMEKTCTKCGVTKSIEEFHLQNMRSDGRSPQCRECVNEYHRKNSNKPPRKKLTEEEKEEYHQKYMAEYRVNQGHAPREKSLEVKVEKITKIKLTPEEVKQHQREATLRQRAKYTEEEWKEHQAKYVGRYKKVKIEKPPKIKTEKCPKLRSEKPPRAPLTAEEKRIRSARYYAAARLREGKSPRGNKAIYREENGKKRCTECEEVKPIESFCKNKLMKDGHSSICRQCVSKLRRNEKPPEYRGIKPIVVYSESYPEREYFERKEAARKKRMEELTEEEMLEITSEEPSTRRAPVPFDLKRYHEICKELEDKNKTSTEKRMASREANRKHREEEEDKLMDSIGEELEENIIEELTDEILDLL